MAGKKSDFGPIGIGVTHRIRRWRERRNYGYAELSRRVVALGRDIAPLGLRRIEAGERRVDADDLVALALALDVSPLALLLPTETGKLTDEGPVYTPEEIWTWAHGERPLSPDVDALIFLRDSNPLHWPLIEKRVREQGFDSFADAVLKTSANLADVLLFQGRLRAAEKKTTNEQEQGTDGDDQ